MTSTLARAGFAAHGMLSILAYVLFVVLGILAWRAQKGGRWFFPEHPVLTRFFVSVWTVSVVSGEAIFAQRYLM
jgi:uncharacterized membrane protein YozB (DUF420 family)